MKHPENSAARSFDSPLRCKEFTDLVYSGASISPENGWKELARIGQKFNPAPSNWNIYYGDLHGHSTLSDGRVDADSYFRNLRDKAKLDFCALTDHDHGGVGKEELWKPIPEFGNKSKWQIILEKTDEYYAPGIFSTIPGYERDSYPWYSNMVLYYQDTQNAEMYRGKCDGEITERELIALSAQDNILYGPHTCSRISDGCYLTGRSTTLMPKTFEIYSRSGAYEYYQNPFAANNGTRGGNYIDALENGAHPACIACSDDHNGLGGKDLERNGQIQYTGVTGILAKENTREALFDALRKRRCFAFMGEKKIKIDFQINGHEMGAIFQQKESNRAIWYSITSEVPVKQVDLIKNGESVVFWRGCNSDLVFDYHPLRREDYYYLRIQLEDGRFAWTSAIWIQQ